MTLIKTACATLIPALAALPGLAEQMPVAPVVVEQAYAFATPDGVPVGAGYFLITNTGAETVVLRTAEAEFPRVMVHESVMVDGLMQMEHRMAVEIPPGETVTFEPGGLHIMFMGLDEPLSSDDDFTVTLVFEGYDPLDVTFTVKDRE